MTLPLRRRYIHASYAICRVIHTSTVLRRRTLFAKARRLDGSLDAACSAEEKATTELSVPGEGTES